MSTRTALVLIDAQANMFDPLNPVCAADGLLERLMGLVASARAAGAPVLFVRNCGGAGDPDERNTPGWELHPSLQPADAELVLDKVTCDTFASTTLGEELESRGVTHVILAGLQSEYCIRESTLGALARGLGVTLTSNGHSTCDSGDRRAPEIIAAVNAEFEGRVNLVKTEDVQFS